MSKKRDRGKNFTDKEREEFLDIIEKHLNVIENKKTDCITVKRKQAAWEDIAKEFNAIQNTGIRNGTQLKNLYDSIKKKMKKDKADDKVS